MMFLCLDFIAVDIKIKEGKMRQFFSVSQFLQQAVFLDFLRTTVFGHAIYCKFVVFVFAAPDIHMHLISSDRDE